MENILIKIGKFSRFVLEKYLLYFSKYSLKVSQRLNHDDCLASSDKRFYLCMQNDGNLVIYRGANTKNRRPIWASNTPGKGTHPHRLEMQSDGNLVMYDSKNRATWASGTHDRGATDVTTIMQSDGNLVIYNNAPLTPLWASQTQRSVGVDCQKEESWPHDWTKFENEVLSLVNEIRAKGAFCAGRWQSPVSPLIQNWKLTYSSRCHAVDMALYDYFAHVDPRGGTMGQRIKKAGYSFRNATENIAQGQKSPHQVVDRWMNSNVHCLNIMGNYQDIGIAYIGDNYYQSSYLWVQNFGTSF